MEELQKEIKEYDEIVKEELDEEDNYSDEFNDSDNDNDNINLGTINFSKKNNMKKFNVYFYFNLNKEKEYNFYIESDLLNINIQYGYDLIKNIIKKINNESIVINNDSKSYTIFLKDCENEGNNFYINNFELREYKKKTLKPNEDLPPFSSNLLLNNIKDDIVSLVCKNNLYIMPLEKYNDIEEEKYSDDFFEDHEDNINKIKNINPTNNKYNCKCQKYDDSNSYNCLIM